MLKIQIIVYNQNNKIIGLVVLMIVFKIFAKSIAKVQDYN